MRNIRNIEGKSKDICDRLIDYLLSHSESLLNCFVWAANSDILALGFLGGFITKIDMNNKIKTSEYNIFINNEGTSIDRLFGANSRINNITKIDNYVSHLGALQSLSKAPGNKNVKSKILHYLLEDVPTKSKEEFNKWDFASTLEKNGSKKDKIQEEAALFDLFVENFSIYHIIWSEDSKKILLVLSNRSLVAIDEVDWKSIGVFDKLSDLLESMMYNNIKINIKIDAKAKLFLTRTSSENYLLDDPSPKFLWNYLTHLSPFINSNDIYVLCSDNKLIYPSLSNPNVIYIYDNDGKKPLKTQLEGHTDTITCLAVSNDGRFLASKSLDDTVRLWNLESNEIVAVLKESASGNAKSQIAFHPKESLLATIDEEKRILRIWNLDLDILKNNPSTIKTVHYASAKVVLVGESNVGKSCLALRLAENRYEEMGTTHGTRIWPILSERLTHKTATPPGEKRDVILWDMGGQDEYRLVHQLFLNDVNLALVLLDPTRGRTAFDEVEGWSKRLDKQLGNRRVTKLLVGTKLDEDSTTIDIAGLERLVKECKFQGYYPVSAKTCRGIDEICKAMVENLDWELVCNTSRPELFQQILDEIESMNSTGEVVISFCDLEKLIQQKGIQFDKSSINAVVEHLAIQGAISNTQNDTGERMLVL